ncbi:MAG: polymer-forming cytoskeletal protein [Ectothiorhodospiraceae bacterium]|jgi:cytoskeletal protein CcmA (bactofilin family)
MFDRSKRGSGRPNEYEADEELEQDRFSGPAAPAASTAPSPSPGAARVREAAVIGPSIHIDGDLRGEEDLVVEGNVNGTIHLQDHGLTIGSKGKVKANVYANSIIVDGTVEGDLYGSERIAIRKSGEVKGNMVSPRVSLEDGGRFKGNIEMDQQAVDSAFGGRRSSPPASAPAKPSGASGTSSSGSSTSSGGESKDEAAKAASTTVGAEQSSKKGATG